MVVVVLLVQLQLCEQLRNARSVLVQKMMGAAAVLLLA